MELVIKWNNCAFNDPCAICGGRTDPLVGPEIFVEGSWGLVCNQCARERARELQQAALDSLDGLDENAEPLRWLARYIVDRAT